LITPAPDNTSSLTNNSKRRRNYYIDSNDELSFVDPDNVPNFRSNLAKTKLKYKAKLKNLYSNYALGASRYRKPFKNNTRHRKNKSHQRNAATKSPQKKRKGSLNIIDEKSVRLHEKIDHRRGEVSPINPVVGSKKPSKLKKTQNSLPPNFVFERKFMFRNNKPSEKA
jgi:hypothetical protein